MGRGELTRMAYRSGPNPYGIVSLARPAMIKTQQDYDISVTLTMPRSPANVDRGNFMISFFLLGSEVNEPLQAGAREFSDPSLRFRQHDVVFGSRRPALVPYIDPIVSVSGRVLFLFYHLFVPSAQRYKMTISLAERVVFLTDSKLPASAYVEVEAGQDIQIYDMALTMVAQLRGLRWLMFHYRLPVYTICTLLFWLCELLFMVLAWATWAALAGSRSIPAGKGQHYSSAADDDGDGAEGDRTRLSDYGFKVPSHGSQPSLKLEPQIKVEEEENRSRLAPDIGNRETDADDEYDEYDGDDGQRRIKDSGLATSFSEEGGGFLRRRASRSVR